MLQFRDEYSVFTSAGAEVVGISSDKPDALAKFVKSQRLNFPLLSDEGSKLRKGLKVKGVHPKQLCRILRSQGEVPKLQRIQAHDRGRLGIISLRPNPHGCCL